MAAAPPPLGKYLGEVRALGALASFLWSGAGAAADAHLPRGDGHPVIVYPGLLGSDLSTQALRSRLAGLGYDVHGWGLGQNLGLRPDTLSEIRSQLVAVTRAAGRPASLFGWSLGGLFAREVAKRRPDCVRLVITAGTPCMGDLHATNAWRTYERLNRHAIDDPPIDIDLETLPPVPVTSIYSEEDGIVSPGCADIGCGARHETIRVDSTHIGLVWSAEVLAIAADRLAQGEGEWAPYTTGGAGHAASPL